MFPDVQKRAPEVRLHLTKVGVSNIKKIIKVPRGEKRPIVLLANFNVFVDLPSMQKGIHMSRIPEAINEVLDELIKRPVFVLEDLCGKIAKEVLARHEYARECEVEMESRLMVRRELPASALETQKFVDIAARAKAMRGEGTRLEREVGTGVEGVLFFPNSNGEGQTQAAVARLSVQFPENTEIRIEDLIDILEGSMSSGAYSSFTPEDKKALSEAAKAKPASPEEVVEKALKEAATRFASLPSETRLTASCVVKEAMASYTSSAEKTASVGQLRAGSK